MAVLVNLDSLLHLGLAEAAQEQDNQAISGVLAP